MAWREIEFAHQLISGIIGSRLLAAMFQNVNLDDIENLIVDINLAFSGG